MIQNYDVKWPTFYQIITHQRDNLTNFLFSTFSIIFWSLKFISTFLIIMYKCQPWNLKIFQGSEWIQLKSDRWQVLSQRSLYIVIRTSTNFNYKKRRLHSSPINFSKNSKYTIGGQKLNSQLLKLIHTLFFSSWTKKHCWKWAMNTILSELLN